MSIKVLTPEVVNQIAAGEVVERPAHLVKELVENSLDAGATEIEIEFDEGGRQLRVKDNGCGIAAQELPLALARHATSKITASQDLWQLHSFGFRGEALASIAAVSELNLTSRPQHQDQAMKIVSRFGAIAEPQAAGADFGTTITVQNLFANLPARLKFLKSEAAEHTQIKQVLKALAMAHPQVSFRLRQRGQLICYWSATDKIKTRVADVLEQSSAFYEAQGELDGYRVTAVMSSPNDTVRTSKNIWLFAQNRWIQDRSLQAAVMEAYRGLLMHGEFPLAAVWVECAPDEIDVNIHPTKSQVKFRQTNLAFRAVNKALRRCLEAAPWLDDLLPANDTSTSLAVSRYSRKHLQSAGQLEDHRPISTAFSRANIINRPETPPRDFSDASMRFSDADLERVQFAQKDFALQEVGENLRPNEPLTDRDPVLVCEASDEQKSQQARWGALQVLGQAHLTYILTQSEKALLLIDQHAAHERVLYERLLRDWQQGKMEIQSHLLPLTLTLSEEQVQALEDIKPDLQTMGIDLQVMGPTLVAVNAAPAMLKDHSLKQGLELLAIEKLERGDSFALERRLRDVAATMACHSAVRAGQALSLQEMVSLLKQMDEFPLSSFCPHGRPVFVEYPFARLERDFGRIV